MIHEAIREKTEIPRYVSCLPSEVLIFVGKIVWLQLLPERYHVKEVSIDR